MGGPPENSSGHVSRREVTPTARAPLLRDPDGDSGTNGLLGARLDLGGLCTGARPRREG